MKRVAALVGIWILIFAGSASGVGPAPTAEGLFATRVLPVFQAKCVACHGGDPKKIQGGLDLTSRAPLLKGGDSATPGVVEGKPGESAVFRAVQRTDPHVPAMPPKENDKLTAEETASLRAWIEGGAPWPAPRRVAELTTTAPATGVRVKTSGGLSDAWTNRTYAPDDLWAYRPVRKPEWGGSVDGFLTTKMKALGVDPAPPADRRTLIRRVTFDLTGLPPSPSEIDDFLADKAGEEVAFARVVDRLMASPHYGEQMARHWLDVARYADSAGLANDYERGNAWRYRDYVVRAFNADRPYDRFAAEQIAGDEIDPGDPEKLVAVGFLRMGAWELTSMEVPRVARQKFLDDVTDAVGQVFLGQMLQCARCHDHKFDPIPTRDYYRVQAAFATTQIAERPAAFLSTERTAGFEERKYLAAGAARFVADPAGEPPPKGALGRIASKDSERAVWARDRYEPIAHSVYTGNWPGLSSMAAPFRVPKLDAATRPEKAFLLAGGDPFAPKDAVSPGVLSVLPGAAVPETMGGRRRALAAWVADARNPLFARVMANRVWQWTFGRGVAGNPNNFGATGRKPSHPELLDWLAAEFAANGWSVKALHRTLVLSEAYRRSSRHPDDGVLAARDPDGVSYAAFRPRRLAAEEIRDAMLAVSGELRLTVGGIPVRPELPDEIAFQPRQVMGTFAPAWEPSPSPDQRHRRTIYALKLRGLRDPTLDVFDAPSPDLSCERRDVSTVAPQAFALFNGESTRGRALAFATRLSKTVGKRPAAIDAAFLRAYGRPPTDRERTACLGHWAAMAERHKAIELPKSPRPTEILREAVDEVSGGKFTYREVLVSAKDFVPDAHPVDAPAELRGLMEVCLVLFNTNEFLYVD